MDGAEGPSVIRPSHTSHLVVWNALRRTDTCPCSRLYCFVRNNMFIINWFWVRMISCYPARSIRTG